MRCLAKNFCLEAQYSSASCLRELEWTDSRTHNLVWQPFPATIQRRERQENEVRMPKLLLQLATARRLSCEKLVASGPKNVAGLDCEECCFAASTQNLHASTAIDFAASCGRLFLVKPSFSDAHCWSF